MGKSKFGLSIDKYHSIHELIRLGGQNSKSIGFLELNAMGPDWGWTLGIWGLGFDNSKFQLQTPGLVCISVLFYMYV